MGTGNKVNNGRKIVVLGEGGKVMDSDFETNLSNMRPDDLLSFYGERVGCNCEETGQNQD